MRGIALGRDLAEHDPHIVTVRADEEVAHKHVVAVMDACVRAGIEDYRVQSADVGADDAGPDDAGGER